MFTLPSRDPKAPLKCNILWVISEGHVLDIGQFYTVLREMRDNMPIHLIKVENEDRMPDEPEFKDNNKHKYTQIKRALVQLEREGWPIHKQLVNGVAWYGMGRGFDRFFLERLKEYYEDALIRHDNVQRYAARPDVQARYLKKMNPSKKLMVKYPEVTIEDQAILSRL